MQLKYNQLRVLASHLEMLESSPTQQGGVSPYAFSGKVRVALAVNLKRIKDALGVVDELQNKLIKELDLEVSNQGNGQISVKGENLGQFTEKIAEILSQTVDIDIKQVSINDLDLSRNPIKSDYITALMDTVLTDEEYKEPEQPPAPTGGRPGGARR